jgi:hypothetical protein
MATTDKTSGKGLGMTGQPQQDVPDPFAVFADGVPEETPSAPAQPTEPAETVETPPAEPGGAEGTPPAEAGGTEAPSGEPETPAPPQETPEGQFSFAGRTFPTREQAEQSYHNMQAMSTRAQQERDAIQQQALQYEEALRQVAPYLQQMNQQQMANLPELGDIDLSDPNAPQAIQQVIDQRVEARLNEALGQMSQAQMEQQEKTQTWVAQNEYVRQAQGAVETFRGRHPDAAPGTPVDLAMGQTMSQLRMDPRDPDVLDIVYDAVQNPVLGNVLSVNPHYAATPQGRDLLRQLAGLAASAPGGTPAAGQAARPRPVAHVETGGSGAPTSSPPGSRPEKDEVQQVVEMAQTLRDKRTVFGGYRR